MRKVTKGQTPAHHAGKSAPSPVSIKEAADSSGDNMNHLEKLLDEIGAGMLLLDPQDLPAVAALHDQFLSLAKLLETEARSWPVG